ncbi:low-density lipoprotein receptor-related protein 1B-like isoform X2 [Acanthaster planci]|uniref:Low-density lipoprotein receptor-related protein 1B-like isoform X2 n=1 Tax=Acanthaster planci TaxID=133434 RepID=A0A8B7XLW0_ACAPL|nr:low-density lipoprotein receptor-related protein 1B-like isoform X2 [Acanthaster planci]
MTSFRCHLFEILTVFTVFGAFRQADAGDFMLVAAYHNNSIFAGSMSKHLTDLYSLPLQGIQGPIALDFDASENMLYWTEYDANTGRGKLVKAHLNGSNHMTLLTDIRVAFGLALDIEGGRVYWTDNTLGQIGRIPMDGSGSKQIIISGLGRPRGIITDHDRGEIYWTDVGDDSIGPRIEKANLDGTNRVTLINDNIVWPQAVILDNAAVNLYWCDGELNTIERTNLLGNNREVLINLTIYAPIHPFDLALYNDYMYWSDVFKESLIRVHLNGRGEQIFGSQRFAEIRRIHIQTEPNYCDSSPCLNGGTCEDVVNGFVCHCVSGFSGVRCSKNHCSCSPCLNGGTCIFSPEGFVCQCPAAYQGLTCERDPCNSSPCLNGGICAISPGGFICHCQAPYEGPTCTLDPCNSSPCVNGGTCIGSATGFTCRCPARYGGPTCTFVDGCVAPPMSDHVRLLERDVTVFTYGESATFTCDNDYTIKESADHSVKRLCLSDGTWSGEPVECFPSETDPADRSPSVVPIASGVGGACFVVFLLIIVVVVFKRWKRQREERVVDVPAVSYHHNPPPSYIPPTRHEPPGYFPMGAINQGFGTNNAEANVVPVKLIPPREPRIYETIVD